MRWIRTDVVAMASIALGVAAAVWRLWLPGSPIEADFAIGVFRAYALDLSWHARQFYPRVSMDLIFGYGGPLFQYYPPVASYLTLVWHWVGLGWVAATKACFTAAPLMAALGAYVYTRWLYSDRRAAWVAAMAYGVAPYLLFCIYERGALAETLALALLPWAFGAVHYVMRSGRAGWIWPAALSIALLILAHNITALFAVPLLLLYLLLVAWSEHDRRGLGAAGAALGLGLGLSAFYWLPALAERNYAQLDRWMLGPDFVATQYLLPLSQLIQPQLAFDYWKSWIPALPMATAILILIGLVGLPLTFRMRQRGGLCWAALVMVPLLLQLVVSRPFWDAVPIARYIQFPWRLLGPTSLFAALLGASIFAHKGLTGVRGHLLAGAISALLLYASLNGLAENTRHWGQLEDAQVNEAVLLELGRGNFQLHADYQPAVMEADISEMSLGAPQADSGNLPRLASRPDVRVLEEGPALIQLVANSRTAVTLRLPRIFFPGWQVLVDGHAAQPEASGPWGLLSVELPPGEHRLTARFGETPLRLIADIISVASLIICAAGAVMRRTARRFVTGPLLAVVILAALSVSHQGVGQSPRSPVPFAASLDDDIQLLGYYVPRTPLRPGGTLSVRLYWLAQHTPDQNYRVFLHLVTPDDATRVAQADNEPKLGYRPTTRWSPGEVIVDTQQLALSPDTPPGKYRLLAGMYRLDDVRNLAVRGAPASWPGDRLDLGEILVEK